VFTIQFTRFNYVPSTDGRRFLIQSYQIGGPLLDRINLHIEVPAVPYQEFRGQASGATSADMRARVEHVRGVQNVRGYYNSQTPVRQLRKICALDDAASARSKWRCVGWCSRPAGTS
jgi:predicted ATPase with chaperone activity